MKKIAHKAEGLIQRDALVAHLQSRGIAAEAPNFDIRRKITENTMDLAYEGYSAIHEGFPIYVADENLQEARTQIRAFLASTNLVAVDSSERSPAYQRFYFSAVGCLFFPGLMHAVGLYNLIQALRRGEKPRPAFLVFSLFLFWLTASVWVYLARDLTWNDITHYITTW